MKNRIRKNILQYYIKEINYLFTYYNKYNGSANILLNYIKEIKRLCKNEKEFCFILNQVDKEYQKKLCRVLMMFIILGDIDD